MRQPKDKDYWESEADYIWHTTHHPYPDLSNFNHDKETFNRYCDTQSRLADIDGFADLAQMIARCKYIL